MRALTALDMVRLWEWGETRPPVGRALALLSVVLPDWQPQALSRLSVGQRDGLLLQARHATFGPELEVYVPCPRCEADLEFTLHTDGLLVAPPLEPRPQRTVHHEGIEVVVRAPCSDDLAHADEAPTLDEARARLVERVTVRAQDASGTPCPLPTDAVPAVMEAVRKVDPQADIRFELACAQCGHQWTASFDILAFFWEELSGQMKQICVEVATLAHAFGWSERDILSMSSKRRAWYLQMLGGTPT